MADPNTLILDQIRTMPSGGGYATTLTAHTGLAASVVVDPKTVHIRPDQARPAYCSGATYLVFLKTLQALQTRGALTLPMETWQALIPRLRPDGKDTQPDGHGLWGRWNANGPGTARLFHELKLGRNFTDLTQARPGDFLKIFWTDAVGKNESGHSVIFLGTETVGGVDMVRFWSAINRTVSGKNPSPAPKSPAPCFPAWNTRATSPVGNPFPNTTPTWPVSSKPNPASTRQNGCQEPDKHSLGGITLPIHQFLRPLSDDALKPIPLIDTAQ